MTPAAPCAGTTESVDDVAHLIECYHIQTPLTSLDLWPNPVRAAVLVDEWEVALAMVEEA